MPQHDDIFQGKASLIMFFKANNTMIQTHTSRCRHANAEPVNFFFVMRTSSFQVFIHEYTYCPVSSDLSLSVWTFKTCSYLIAMEGHWSTPPALSDLLNWTTKAKSVCAVKATKRSCFVHICSYFSLPQQWIKVTPSSLQSSGSILLCFDGC